MQRAVTSALEQTWPPAEIIVVDDASDDLATAEVIRVMETDREQSAVRIVRLAKNVGPAGARNEGWALSSQRYIAFLDSDDAWHPQKLELQLTAMLEEKAAISGHDFAVWAPASSSVAEFRTPTRRTLSPQQLLFRNWYPTPTVILRSSIRHRFNPELRFCEDYDLWLRIALDGNQCQYLPLPLAYNFKEHFGSSGLSSQLRRMETAQVAVYRNLHSERKISTANYILLRVWGTIRFVRRVAIASVFHRR